MVVGIGQHARDDATLLRHLQALVLAKFLKSRYDTHDHAPLSRANRPLLAHGLARAPFGFAIFCPQNATGANLLADPSGDRRVELPIAMLVQRLRPPVPSPICRASVLRFLA